MIMFEDLLASPMQVWPIESETSGSAKNDNDESHSESRMVEVGDNAHWQVSTYKANHGVSNLRDGRLDTFWQSDGLQPHTITVTFNRKTPIRRVSLYVDYKVDESYTPQRLHLRAGACDSDVRLVATRELNEHSGWVHIGVANSVDPQRALRCFILQVVVVSNHQSGRDTHIRQVRLFSRATDFDSYRPPFAFGYPIAAPQPVIARPEARQAQPASSLSSAAACASRSGDAANLNSTDTRAQAASQNNDTDGDDDDDLRLLRIDPRSLPVALGQFATIR